MKSAKLFFFFFFFFCCAYGKECCGYTSEEEVCEGWVGGYKCHVTCSGIGSVTFDSPALPTASYRRINSYHAGQSGDPQQLTGTTERPSGKTDAEKAP